MESWNCKRARASAPSINDPETKRTQLIRVQLRSSVVAGGSGPRNTRHDVVLTRNPISPKHVGINALQPSRRSSFTCPCRKRAKAGITGQKRTNPGSSGIGRFSVKGFEAALGRHHRVGHAANSSHLLLRPRPHPDRLFMTPLVAKSTISKRREGTALTNWSALRCRGSACRARRHTMACPYIRDRC